MLQRKELSALMISVVLAKTVLMYPKKIIENSGNAAWLEGVVSLLLALALYFIISKLCHDKRSILEKAYEYGGSGLRIVCAMLLIAIFGFNFITVIKEFPNEIKLILLQNFSADIILIMFGIAVAAGAWMGIKSLGRINYIFMPMVSVTLFLFYVLLIPNYKIYNLLPILGKGWKSIALGGVKGITTYADILIINLLLPYFKNMEEARKSGRRVLIISGSVIITILLAQCLVYPYPTSENLIFPMYQLARMIHLSAFFSRFEAIFQFTWTILLLIYSAVYIYVICHIFKEAFGLRYIRPVLCPVVIIVMSLVLLTGCTGTEPNEIAYVSALGIDAGDDGNYKITIQYANPSVISGDNQSASDEETAASNIIIEAPNVYSAVGLANQIESRTFSLAHTKLVVVSREVAQDGIMDIAELLMRSEELRPDIYLAVAMQSAEEYLESVNSVMKINPAKYYQLVFDKSNIMGSPEGIEKNFVFGIETGDYDSLLPIASVSKEGEEETEEEIRNSPFEFKMRDYTAGKNMINSKSKNEVIGSALFKGDKMVGILGSVETEVYKLLDSDYSVGYFTLYNEKTPNSPVTIKITQKKSPKYDIDIDKKRVRIRLCLEGDIYAVSASYSTDGNLPQLEENASRYISEECEKFAKEIIMEYNSDILHLNERSKGKLLTFDEYESYRSQADYSEFDIEVQTEFRIRSTGLK